MDFHIGTVGTLNVILGCLGLIMVFSLFDLFKTNPAAAPATHNPLAGIAFSFAGSIFLGVLNTLGNAIAAALLIFSIACLAGGIGVLRRARWSRVLMIVVSVFELFYFPFGTPVGVYGIWCLSRKETKSLFAPDGAAVAAKHS